MCLWLQESRAPCKTGDILHSSHSVDTMESTYVKCNCSWVERQGSVGCAVANEPYLQGCEQKDNATELDVYNSEVEPRADIEGLQGALELTE